MIAFFTALTALLGSPACDIRTANDIFIQETNRRDLSYEVEHNQFSDIHYINGKNPDTHHYVRPEHKTPYLVILDDTELPTRVDWRDTHDVSSVKNQLNCGSCWAFSATGATESAWSIHHHHKLYNLSQQELVDCSGSYGNQGCDGGMMDNAFQYIIDNGLCANNSYPYQANSGQCMNTTCQKVVHIKKYHDIKTNDEHALAKAVARQPVSVAIQANLQSFQLYKSGIYSDPNCGDDLDHGVLVVGYGYDSSWDMKYWIVKNSWGSTWGDNGYIRIQKDINDSSGLCGIAIDPSIPIVSSSDTQYTQRES
jgi:C1A family cysteine protease